MSNYLIDYTACKTYYKNATSDESVLGIRKETQGARILNLAIIIKAKGKQFKQLTEGFCSDSVDTCIMASGNEGNNGLQVAKDMC